MVHGCKEKQPVWHLKSLRTPTARGIARFENRIFLLLPSWAFDICKIIPRYFEGNQYCQPGRATLDSRVTLDNLSTSLYNWDTWQPLNPPLFQFVPASTRTHFRPNQPVQVCLSFDLSIYFTFLDVGARTQNLCIMNHFPIPLHQWSVASQLADYALPIKPANYGQLGKDCLVHKFEQPVSMGIAEKYRNNHHIAICTGCCHFTLFLSV